MESRMSPLNTLKDAKKGKAEMRRPGEEEARRRGRKKAETKMGLAGTLALPEAKRLGQDAGAGLGSAHGHALLRG